MSQPVPSRFKVSFRVLHRIHSLRSAQALAVIVAVWLLPLTAPAASRPAWIERDAYRLLPLTLPKGNTTGFSRLSPEQSGVLFTNRLSPRTVATNRLYEIGSGVTLGDIDGDGWVDLYFCGLESENVLYRNLGGERFEDITRRAGVACAGRFCIGCAFVDLDGDHDLDLLVTSLGGGITAFRNDGSGIFTEIPDSGLFRQLGATSVALADIDHDGDLDLYVANYRTDTFVDNPPGLRMEMRQQADGKRALEPRDRFVTVENEQGVPTVIERGEPDVLYLNRGKGRFLPALWHTGLFLDEHGVSLKSPPTDWGLSALFRDLNQDGWPDLYVCNDFVAWPDRIWFNEGGRRFRAASTTAFRCVSLASMAVDVADINRDGWDDLFVADMLNPHREARAWQRPDLLRETIRWPVEDPAFRPEVPRNTLQVSRGDGTYAEIASFAGIAATDWTPSAVFLDVDLDGWEDLLIAAGNLHDVQDLDAQESAGRMNGSRSTFESRLRHLDKLPSRPAPSLAFRNRHDATFEDQSEAWRFNEPGIGNGMALGDLDNDGDLDVVVNCMNEAARVYRNLSSAARIGVRLRGTGENSRAIGARIEVRGGPVVQTQEMTAGGRYASSDDPMRVFAAGAATELTLAVSWPTGGKTVVPNALPNHIYEVIQPAASVEPAPSTNQHQLANSSRRPIFEDLSATLRHVHQDAPFDDFARHPLLPRRLSTLGPGMTWVDLNEDGFDDLVVTGGREGKFAAFNGAPKARFAELPGFQTRAVNARDQTSVLPRYGTNGAPGLLIGESNWETPNAPESVIRLLSFEKTGTSVASPGGMSEMQDVGPMASADLDGDGDLDVFIGSRAVPGRYPEAGRSWILRSEPHGFATPEPLEGRMLASGAVFSDLDGDGDPDLAVACDWDSIRIFHNERGTLKEVTREYGLDQWKGWWNGVTAGDFDGDGRMDLIASNWGTNWRSDPLPDSRLPMELYFGEFAEPGIIQTVLVVTNTRLSKAVPWRERSALTAVIPSVALRLPTRHKYGFAGIAEVLGEHHATSSRLSVTTFDSIVLLNRTNHFEIRQLPAEAQWSAAFGISVADFDGDGNEDVFLAQNFFGMDAETSRQDAGAGLLLLGDGQGHFRAVSPGESGIGIYGEQRSSTVVDLDRDNHPDLVVAQYSGPLRVLRNRGDWPAVSVRVRGSTLNPVAAGVVVRLRFGERLSPAREIHLGAGYWSVDSSTLTFAAPELPSGVQIRWPGGRLQESPWPAGARRIELTPTGASARDH